MLKNIILIFLCILVAFSTNAQQLILQKRIYFSFNRSYLKTSERKKLDSIITIAKAQPDYTIALQAYTDSLGSPGFNQKLSSRRKDEVVAYLKARGIDPERIRAEEFGESLPEVQNSSENNRALNRRVEINVYQNEVQTVNTDDRLVPPGKDTSRFVKADNGILIDYGKNEKGTLMVSTMTNTTQMDAENFTTMTTDNEILASNLVFRWQSNGTAKENALIEPIRVRVPVGKRRYCKPSEVSYYSQVTDSTTGEKKWKLIQEKPTIIKSDGKQYFEFIISTLLTGSINCDRQISNYNQDYSKIKLNTRQLKITGIKVIYETLNVLYTGYPVRSNTWAMKVINRGGNPLLKVTALDKSGKEYRATIPVGDIRYNSITNSYILKRYFFRRV